MKVDLIEVERLVKEWKKTKSEDVFIKLLTMHKYLINHFKRKFHYLEQDELEARLQEEFFNSLFQFKVGYHNDKYEGAIYFTVFFKMNALNMCRNMVRENYRFQEGGYWDTDEDGNEVRKKGLKVSFDLKQTYANSKTPVFLSEVLTNPDGDSDFNDMEFEDSFTAMVIKYDIPERVADIIRLRMQGYTQVEIGEMFGIAQPRVNRLIKKLYQKHPDLHKYIKENFLEK